MKNYLYILLLLIPLFSFGQSDWQIPEQAKEMNNPLANITSSIETGKKIFQKLCASCHGITGKGDVPAMQSLQPKPTDLTSETVQSQPDGVIFWKLSEGRGLMAGYKNMLSEQERWAVVNYIRSLKQNPEIEKNNAKKAKIIKRIENQKTDAFPFTYLINTKTTHIIPKKGFGLNIQHRFGATKFDKNLVQNFIGLDLAANMRFAFEIPVNNKLYIEIGRTRYGKFYDLGGKYLILQQTKDNKTPVSIALYENIAITTEKPLSYSESASFEDGSAFVYKFYHRLYYDTQIIFSKKFTHNFSAQITGELIWRNLTPPSIKPKEKSYIIALPVSFRYKLGMRSAIDFEIIPNNHHRTMPIAIGYEVASSGNHVFQITITNSDRILSQNLLTNPTLKYGKDGFMLGFNLIRYF